MVKEIKLKPVNLIGEIIKKVKPRKVVAQVIIAAYADGYEAKSDGISVMPDYAMGFKHPAGIGHDFLYYLGTYNPFLPKIINSNYAARSWADAWFRSAMIDFGHPWRARIYWLALRVGGWWGWRKHRKAGHPFTKGKTI